MLTLFNFHYYDSNKTNKHMDFLFGSCLPSTTQSDEFAHLSQQVLDLEIKFNFSPSFKNLSSLTQLYSQAIEYYESIQSPKFKYYSHKLSSLLRRPEAIFLLNERNSPRSQNRPQYLFFSRSSNSAIQSSASASVELSYKLNENIRKQTESLHSRLILRKKGKQNKLLNQNTNSKLTETNHNTTPEAKQVFESEIEVIIDRYTEAKAKIRNEIEEEYKIYIQELDSYSGELIENLKSQLQKDMLNEILDKIQILEENKNKEIKKARQKLIQL